MRLVLPTVFLFPVLSSAVLSAQALMDPVDVPKSGTAYSKAREFRKLVVSGGENKSRVDTVRRELRWHTTAKGAAREARQLGRPIFMVQALGSLKGLC